MIIKINLLSNSMVQANQTIFFLYLSLMDFLSKSLSEKYPDSSSDKICYYKTVIIQKIVRMFHSLNSFVKNSQDEVSARCLLRGILDSVTTYSFIYERDDEEEVMFRHYLYALDSYNSYKKSSVVYTNGQEMEPLLDHVIEQLLDEIHRLQFFIQEPSVCEILIKEKNWRFESLENKRRCSYNEMYKKVGFHNEWATYYQEYLSQFVHGLCFSNKVSSSTEQVKHVLYESIPIADKMMRAISETFQIDQMITDFCFSSTFKELYNSPEFNPNDWWDFMESLRSTNKTFIV